MLGCYGGARMITDWQSISHWWANIDWRTTWAGVSALATFMIFWVAHRFGRKARHADSLQYYNESSQAVNFKVLTDEAFAAWYRDQYHYDFSSDFVRRLYHCHWTIHFVRWADDTTKDGLLRISQSAARAEKRLKRMIRRNSDCLGYLYKECADEYQLDWLLPRLKKNGFKLEESWTEEHQRRAARERPRDEAC